MTYDFGTDNTPGIVLREAGLLNVVYSDTQLTTDGNYDNIYTEKELDIPDCTNRNRLAWRASFQVRGGGVFSTITAGHAYVYLDDVRVSILQ